MPFSFASKIIDEFHVDDVTTPTGQAVGAGQWLSRTGTGHSITGPIMVDGRFGTKRAARVTTAATRILHTSIPNVVAYLFIVGATDDESGISTYGNDLMGQDQNFNVSEPRVDPQSRRWYNARAVSKVGYQNGLRSTPASWSRRVAPGMYYVEFTNSGGWTLDSFGTWNAPTADLRNNLDAGVLMPLSAKLTPAEIAEATAKYRPEFGFAGTLPPVIVFRGDSLTEGWETFGSGAQKFAYPSQLSAMPEFQGWDMVQAGIGGTASTSILTVDSGSGYPGIPTNEQVWLPLETRPAKKGVLWIGTNDIGTYSTGTQPNAGLTLFNNIVSICNEWREAGIEEIYLCTLLDRGDSTLQSGVTRSQFDASRTQANNLIINNFSESSTGANGVVANGGIIQLHLRPELQNPANTTYFGDELHLKQAGYAIVAEEVRDTGISQLSPDPSDYNTRGRNRLRGRGR